ncbi:hypothetical protein [Methylomagnum ishizawai]|uniref:hypothetical protein n=1 Tax=Methylomagnum ishizawai TaxID=1760988 RepID=UPI001C333E95|nr:hypothetical protein [Methylomagnum ishizawai]BBL77348.1 hypothetical protein MishRS11D_44460 [Methylomagnum ishizawai]
MSIPFGPFALTLDDITKRLRGAFGEFADPRRGRNKTYTMVDAALSAFSVFFTQSPSFLDYQRSLEQAHGTNNARTLFGVHEVPSDNQIRALLDATPPERLGPVYAFLFDALARAGVVDTYRSPGGALLLALDGTEYFSSQAIHCERCSARRHANGKATYFHTVLTPVLVKPGGDKVIPLAPEFVRPQDGADKQDCELNAAKRWLAGPGAEPALRGATLLGDDLYCHEPFCRELRASGFGFVLVCKPDSHPVTYEWLGDLQRQGAVGTVAHRRWTGRRHETDTYRYAASVPLRDADDALMVNWCELVTTDDHGKVLYRNAFATDRPIDAATDAATVEAGRCRWKVERVPQAHGKGVREEPPNRVEAAWKMRAGPSESAFRSGLQTTPSRCGQEPSVVSVGVKASGLYPGQVWIRETNESEPSMTRRKPEICRRNQGRLYPLGQVCRIPDYWAGGGRRIGGVKLIQASVWNCGNQSPRWQGRSTSGRNHEARVPMRGTGTDRSVVAGKAGNAAGAKGPDQAAALGVQLATGGNG